MDRNTASQKLTFFAFTPADGLPKTGDAANITMYVQKDDGSVTALTDTSASELDATNAKGMYVVDLTQGETDFIKGVFTGKSSTSGVVIVPQTIYSVPAGFSAGTGGVRLSDGVAHGGTLGSSTATLALSRIVASSQTSNQPALHLQGNGSGCGFDTRGGATGHGVMSLGGGTSGFAAYFASQASGQTAVYLDGSGSGAGLVVASGSGTALSVSGPLAVSGAVSLGSTLAITGAFTSTNASNDIRLGSTSVGQIQSGLSTLTQTQVTGGAYALNSASFAFNLPHATAAQINSLAVNTRANIHVPIEIETPDASTQVYKIRLHLFDVEGNMEAPDSTPTIALTNAAGTDRSSRLSIASNPSTGVYTWDYTATAGDAEEQLVWVFTVVEGGLTRTYPATSYVVEETAYRFSSSDRATLNAAATATALAALDTKIGTPAGASVSADIATKASQTSVDDVPNNSEFTAALAAADDAVLTAIAALNNLSNAQLTAAIAAGDDATLAAIAALVIPTAAQNAAGVLDLANGIETGLTLREALRLIAAASAGKLSGAATTTIVIRNAVADSKNRITATVDSSGNRSAVTLDLT